ncbi:MAG: hypothetical protein OHK0046_48560 [Anaerolineae bacterium]
MLLGIILRRMWRERRLMGVLLLALCLVTAFLALGPLYVYAVNSAEFNLRVSQAADVTFQVDLVNPTRFDETRTNQILSEELGLLIEQQWVFQRSAGIECGYFVMPDGTVSRADTEMSHCYRPSAYRDFDQLFSVVEGRPPQSTEDGPVEAVISRSVVERAEQLHPDNQFGLGSQFYVGPDTGTTALVEIVGIVEPALPLEDVFWQEHREVFGRIVSVTDNIQRIDFALIMPEDMYDTHLLPATQSGDAYVVHLEIDGSQLSAGQLESTAASIQRLEQRIRDFHPSLNLRAAALQRLIEDFRNSIAATQGPITLLSLVVLVLMLYNLVTTVALILEQQGEEWAAIASRGGSVRQLVQIQFMTVALLGVVAFVLGPLIAQGIMVILEAFGPQAAILNPQDLGAIPGNAYVLSLVASIAAVIMLTLPAWPAARGSILRLRRGISRPPAAPAWARFFLDFILLFLGVMFLLRLYGFAGGDLQALLNNPAQLTRLLTTNGLSDPFSLLGPVLFLTGAALLWLRVFPLLMRAIGFIFSRGNGLTIPLALWNVEREPGHYAQLVLLLIGTLALGTASLALSETREAGAWETARLEAGADLRIELMEQTQLPPDAYANLPGVVNSVPVMLAESTRIEPNPPIRLFGIDLDEIDSGFRDYMPSLVPLLEAEQPPLPGQVLPAEAQTIALDLYAVAPADNRPVAVNLVLHLLDADHIPHTLTMQTQAGENAATGQFVTHTGVLGDLEGRVPYRLTGLRLIVDPGAVEDAYSQVIYIDHIRAVTAAGENITVADFETDTGDTWTWAPDARQPLEVTTVNIVTVQASEGVSSLRVRPQIERRVTRVNEPLLELNAVALEPLPVVVSPAFAEQFGRRSHLNRTLRPGDVATSLITFPFGAGLDRTDVEIRYRVVGIIDRFPIAGQEDAFLVAVVPALQQRLNADRRISGFYTRNHLWVQLESKEPSPALRDTVQGLPGFNAATFAWDIYQQTQREPLPNALTGMLFASFWVSLGLSLLDFAFYMAVTARRRAVSFAVLRSIGWDARNIWGLLTVEQAAFITPALVVGVVLGIVMAYLILPFLGLIGGQTLQLPLGDVLVLVGVLIIAFTLLLSITAYALRRASLNEILRIEH